MIGFLFTVILFLCYNFFVRDEIIYINNMHKEIVKLENEIQFVENNELKLNTKDYFHMKDKIKNYYNEYAIGLESHHVLSAIEEYAKKAGINILSFESEKISKDKNMKVREYNLILKGSYDEFITWLQFLEQTPYYRNISNLYIKNSPNDSNEEIIYISMNNVCL